MNQHTRLVNRVLLHASEHGWGVLWRLKQGGGKVGGRYMQFGLVKGASDIIGLTRAGRFVAIECKTGKGVLSKEQKQFLNIVKSNGGHAILITEDNLNEKLEELK